MATACCSSCAASASKNRARPVRVRQHPRRVGASVTTVGAHNRNQALASLKGKDILRRIRFAPYRKGMGPTFSLTTWDPNRIDTAHHRSSPFVGYRLVEHPVKGKPFVLFEGEDYSGSPGFAIDSDENLAGLMGFLTLRPGDTDEEYFEKYTPQQLEYADKHAESLSLAVMDKLGEY